MKPVFCFLLSILFFCIVLTHPAQADTPWSPNVQVSATTGNESTIAVFYPNVYVSYNSNPQRFRRSTDAGLSWQPETNFAGTCCDGSMYTDELGYVHISILSPGVRYYRSTDMGVTWSNALILNSGTPSG